MELRILLFNVLCFMATLPLPSEHIQEARAEKDFYYAPCTTD